MTQLQELRKQAKERGLRGYSTMRKDDLCLLLAGKPVAKRLRKNQVSVKTQTDFRVCNDCGLRQYIDDHLMYKVERKIIYDGDLEFDANTGELVGCAVDYCTTGKKR